MMRQVLSGGKMCFPRVAKSPSAQRADYLRRPLSFEKYMPCDAQLPENIPSLMPAQPSAMECTAQAIFEASPLIFAPRGLSF
jgi:hypothetical protein